MRLLQRSREYHIGALPGLILFLFGQFGEAQVWTSIGPAPLAYGTSVTVGDPAANQNSTTGRVSSIAVDPSDSSHWIIGAATGGVWESHNSGASWVPKTDDQPTLAIGSVAFAPSNPKIIYAGTGEAGFVGFTKGGLGVLKSTDGGTTWNLLGAASFARNAVSDLRVHPSNSNIILAATIRGHHGRDGGCCPTFPQVGVLKSTDGGSTWASTLRGEATALEVDPANFNNQYAAIGTPNFPAAEATTQFPRVANGVYRSADGGQTWAPISGPWSGTATTTGHIALSVAPSNPNTVYASIQGPSFDGTTNQTLLGLFRTDTAWAATPAWIQIPTDVTSFTTPDGRSFRGYCNQCLYAHVISVDPSDRNTLFAGGYSLWRCGNCGAAPSWTEVGNKGPHPDYHSLSWAGNRLIAATDGGVWSSTDRGESWRSHNVTLSLIQFFGGALHPTNPNFALGGTQDNRVNIWTGSATWEAPHGARGSFCEGDVIMSSSQPGTHWMAGSPPGRINRTIDGLQSWAAADAGVDLTAASYPIAVRKCPSNDDVFLVGGSRLWRSNNFFSAATPSWVSNGPAAATITAIAFAESDSNCNIYAYGNTVGQIRLTTNGGNSWTDGDPGQNVPGRAVNGLAFDPTNPNTLYVGLSSFDNDNRNRGKPGHVFKSTNAMSASPLWANVSPPADLPFNVITVDPSNPRTLYAGTDAGLWRSADGAATWQRMGPDTGMPNVPVYDIKINPTTGRTIAFTYGRGAYALGLTPPTLIAGSRSPANGATYIAGGLVPGSWAQVQGVNLSGVTRIWNDSDFAGPGNRLPTKLSGVEVKVNGISAAVYYVSPTQVSFQVPNGVGLPGPIPSSTIASVQLFRDGLGSNLVAAGATSSSPGIFPIIVNGKNYPAGVFLDGRFTGDPANGPAFRKAKPGDIVQLFATGLIASTSGVLAGLQAFGPTDLTSIVTVKIGSITFGASAVALVAPGEFQINFTVPQEFATLPNGDYPVSIQLNGAYGPHHRRPSIRTQQDKWFCRSSTS